MITWEKIIYKGSSPLSGEVKITERAGIRRLVVGGFTQSQTIIDETKGDSLYWYHLIPDNLKLNLDSRVLILGLAAGTAAKLITKKFGNIIIDGVEIDSFIIELGKKYFSLEQPNLNIFTEDAEKFLKEARYKYDLICVDVFNGSKIPKQLENKQVFTKIKTLLKESGTVSFNKIFANKKELEDYEALVQSVFPNVESRILRGNLSLNNVIVYAQV